jgi:hypothetical protein
MAYILRIIPAFVGEPFAMMKPTAQECVNWPRGDPPSIRFVALVDLAVGCTYTLLVVMSLAWTDSWLGLAVGRWLRFTDGGVAALLFFLPDPKSSVRSDLILNVTAYRHVLVVCALIAIACTWASRHRWPAEGWRLARILQLSGTPAHNFPDNLRTAYRTAIIGLVAITYLLLLAEPRGDTAALFLYGNFLAFFRAPILLAAICYLACHAVALKPFLPDRDEE